MRSSKNRSGTGLRRQEKKALGNAISELKDAIRKHRAEVGELCRKEDRELYRILDEG
jgi:hypothetical protein